MTISHPDETQDKLTLCRGRDPGLREFLGDLMLCQSPLNCTCWHFEGFFADCSAGVSLLSQNFKRLSCVFGKFFLSL